VSDETVPLLRVVNPDASPEEVAAIVAVFASLGAAAEPRRAPRTLWASRQRRTRPPLRPGPGAWRASGLPR
jgi:hypothetical protein